MDELPNITIPYNKEIDEDALETFLKVNKIRIKIDYILDTWKPVEMNFISSFNEPDEVESEEEDFPMVGIDELHDLLDEVISDDDDDE